MFFFEVPDGFGDFHPGFEEGQQVFVNDVDAGAQHIDIGPVI